MRKLLFASVFGCLSISACAPITSHHGFVADKTAKIAVEAGTDNKTTILARYGNPSQIGAFDEEVWYYISSVQTQKAFLKLRTQERNITAISFDDSESVAQVKQYSLVDGRIINYDKHKTPTRGREVTFLEQIFGSVGRAPVSLPGQDPNLPTAAGGPRTQ
jgi:outer membrane protein assembly factor BamE (lipoprotein component of BamABCDE complex)